MDNMSDINNKEMHADQDDLLTEIKLFQQIANNVAHESHAVGNENSRRPWSGRSGRSLNEMFLSNINE